MTDRVRTMTVVLDHDVRTDCLEPIRTALLMVKGVAKVVDGEFLDIKDYTARTAALSGFVLDVYRFASIYVGHDTTEARRQLRLLLDAEDARRKER